MFTDVLVYNYGRHLSKMPTDDFESMAMTRKIVIVSGNPNPTSRTLDAACRLGNRFGAAETEIINLSILGARLLERGGAAVRTAKDAVATADLAIFASPTFKGTYTGLLKLFLDQFESGEKLRNVVAVPLMLGGSATHALAVELHLKPILVELGLICPTPGLYQIDFAYQDDPALEHWLEQWKPVITALIERKPQP